jgi:hypothetical protein
MKSFTNSVLRFNNILLIPIILMMFSCGEKKNNLDIKDSSNTQQKHNIKSFFFLKKGMTYNEVVKYLDANSIKHSNLSTPYWSEKIKNSLKNGYNEHEDYNYEILDNYSKAKYLKIYNYRIGDIFFDELRLYFIDDVVYKLTYKKLYHDYIPIDNMNYYDDLNANRYPSDIRQFLDRLYLKIDEINKEASNSLYLLNAALVKKYGPSNKNNSPNNSFVDFPMGNQYHLSWGDFNNSNLQNIVIRLGNSNEEKEEIFNYDKSNPTFQVYYYLRYYLDVDFTTESQLLKIKQDKQERNRIKEEKRKNEIEKQKQKEQELLDRI